MYKRFILLLILLAAGPNTYATVKTFKNLDYTNLNFVLVYNYDQWDGYYYHYYKGVSDIFNQYIVKLVNYKKLENKKVNVEILSKVFATDRPLEISQNENGYYIKLHGHTDLNTLTRILEYYTSPDWEPIVLDLKLIDNKDDQWKIKKKVLSYYQNLIIKDQFTPDTLFLQQAKVKLFTLDELSLLFCNDNFFYSINNVPLEIKVGEILPVKIKDRFVIQSENHIYIYKDFEIFNQCEIEKAQANMFGIDNQLLKFKTFNNKAELFYGKKPVISYSFDENKFYYLDNSYKPDSY